MMNFVGYYPPKQQTMTANEKTVEELTNDFHKVKCGDYEYDEERLPMVMNTVTPTMLRVAREKLNETSEEVKQEALAELRQLIKGEKNLVTPTTDVFLLAFLRARKYDVKKAFKLLQNYWKFRKDHDEVFRNLDTVKGDELLERNFVGLLSHRDRNGCVVFVAKAAQWDPDVDSYDTLFRAITAILVYTQNQEATQINGFRAIFDLRGITWKQIKYGTPSNVLLIVRSTQFSYPARYQGAHILSDNKSLKIIWGLVYPLLTQKLRKRIMFHGEDTSDLHKYIHPSVIPKDLGGEGPPLNNSIMMSTLKNKNNHLFEQMECGYKD